ncbi:MAG: DUF1566 domain-containing protein [Desulfobacteraceae bacterium]|nr:MAG: DUF1566 domain-containing protein [Desulfobacteraceae bacterium]
MKGHKSHSFKDSILNFLNCQNFHSILLTVGVAGFLWIWGCASPPQNAPGSETSYSSPQNLQPVQEVSSTRKDGGARVENLSVRQDGLDAVLNYDLIGEDSDVRDEVIVDISLDDGKTWKTPKGLWGDVGKGIGTGRGKRIQWAVLEEFNGGLDAVVRFRVVTLTERDSPPSAGPDEVRACVARDGRFCLHGNGIVKDTSTGLEWFSGPDKNLNWHNARSWIQSINLEGGGWRMPTLSELEGLYTQGAGTRNMTSLLKTSSWHVWSGEIKDSSFAWGLYFRYGERYSSRRTDSSKGGVLAVRSRGNR